jgi:hypothetical protein
MTTVSSMSVKPRDAGRIGSAIIEMPDQQTKRAHAVAGMGHLCKTIRLLA